MIQSAVLLAAGRGNRLRPYTDHTPKPLLPVAGRPTLDYILGAVKSAGIRRACLVTHHLEEQIFAYVGNGARWGLEVSFFHQKALGGTSDALRSVPRTWLGNEPFLLAATDYILEEYSLRELVQAHQEHQAQITISLKACSSSELAARSSVQVEADWQVRRIIEKPTPEQILSPYAASFLFILPPAIWDYLERSGLSARGEYEFQTVLEQMLSDGYHAHGVLQAAPGEWNPSLI